MPKRKSTHKSTSRSRRDAVSLLKADHREVEGWFEAFEKTRGATRKKSLAARICNALKVHTQIEEEIFYPAFLESAQEKDIHHEAIVEHDGAKQLIAQIEASSPADEYYDAKVTVLSEMIKHHVKEEEQPGGMFSTAKQSDMDLAQLGQQMATRKKELTASQRSKGRVSRGRTVTPTHGRTMERVH